MRVFVTGATGFIGSAVAKELMAHGHSVIGTARSDEGAKALAAMGIETHRATLTDLEAMKAGVLKADGVIHLAFNHDFSTYKQNAEDDRVLVEAMGSVSGERPLIVTSGITTGGPGVLAVEDGPVASSEIMPRAASEEAAAVAASKGANVSIVRLPQVHDTRKHGLISPLIPIAMQKGVAAYVGDGMNEWGASHISDVAVLYRLALEKGARDAKYHAVAEEGVSARAIAEAIGRRLKLPVKSIAPEEVAGHFGMFAFFVGLDMRASSAQTRERLGWKPTGPGMVEDLDHLELPS